MALVVQSIFWVFPQEPLRGGRWSCKKSSLIAYRQVVFSRHVFAAGLISLAGLNGSNGKGLLRPSQGDSQMKGLRVAIQVCTLLKHFYELYEIESLKEYVS